MSDKGNLVVQFEDAFQKCISVLTEEDDIMSRKPESTQNAIDERVSNFTDLARQLETYFIQKRFLIYNYKPEMVLKEDTAELKSELVRKDELIRKHYDKLQQWQGMLADVQGVQPSGNSAVRPPGGQLGVPGLPPPGSIPTGGGPLQPGSFPIGAGPMTRMPGPMYGGSSGQSLQGPLAHLERTTSSIGGPLGASGGMPSSGGSGTLGGGPPGMMMGGGSMMGGGGMR